MRDGRQGRSGYRLLHHATAKVFRDGMEALFLLCLTAINFDNLVGSGSFFHCVCHCAQ